MREACAQCVDRAWNVVSCKLTVPILLYLLYVQWCLPWHHTVVWCHSAFFVSRHHLTESNFPSTELLIFCWKKKQNFVGFSGANSRKNWPISRDFCGRKVQIRRKIGRVHGILAEKSQPPPSRGLVLGKFPSNTK